MLSVSIIQVRRHPLVALGVAAREEMEHTINVTCITDGAYFKLKFSEFIKVADIYPQSFPIR